MNTPNGGDFRTGTITGPQRNFPAKNLEDEAAPPFSVVQLYDASRPADLRAYAEFTKPTGDSNSILAFTGPMSILAQDRNNENQAFGSVTQDFPLWAAYNDADGVPVPGDLYEAVAGDWTIRKGGSQFIVIGAAVTDETPPRVLIDRLYGMQTIPYGNCSCCSACVCYPTNSSDLHTSCAGIACLLSQYAVAGSFPWSGETALTPTGAGCTYTSDIFAINKCDIDFGLHYWKLTVSSTRGSSKLELLWTGSAGVDIPLVYWADNFFNPLCGNEFYLEPWCPNTENLKLLWDRKIPNKVCINPGIHPDCRPCSTGGTVQTDCCPNPLPEVIRLTITSDPDPIAGDLCPGISGSYIDVTYDPAVLYWHGISTVCGDPIEARLRCINGVGIVLSMSGSNCISSDITATAIADADTFSCNPFYAAWTHKINQGGSFLCSCCPGSSGAQYIITAEAAP